MSTCSAVTAMLSFEFYTLNSSLPDVVYLSFAGSIGYLLNDNDDAVASRKRKGLKPDRRGGILEDFLSNRELFCT